MNLLQKLILGNGLSKQLQDFQLKYTAANFQIGTRYVFLNGKLIAPADNKKTYIDEGYNKNDIVYAVLNKILNKATLPEWGLYKVVDETKLKESQRLMSLKDIHAYKNIKKALQLKAEAVEPLTKFDNKAGKLKGLLKYANDEYTFSDHQRKLFLYKLLTGDYYEWGIPLKKGANEGVPDELWCLAAHLVNIKVQEGFPVRTSSYELTTFNQEFTKQEVLHERYINPNSDINGQELYGFSPLRAFLKNMTRNNSAKDASTAKFQNGGLDSIIYMDDERLDFTEALEMAKALKTKLANEYSGPENMGKRAISGVKTGVVNLGSTPVELGIIDSEKWDAIMFCNAYDVPPELLGLTQKTYNNVIEAQKALILGAVMPLLISRRAALNWKLQTDWGFKGVNIYVDFETDCFPELMPNAKEIVEASNGIMMITPNEQREMINMEGRPEPEADEVWIKQDRSPLSDYQGPDEIDQALNAGYGGNAAGNGQTSNNGTRVSENGKSRVPLS